MRSVSYLPSSLRSLEQQAGDTLRRYFDGHTADEWVEQHFWPLRDMVRDLEERQRALTSLSAWPRRPLPRGRRTGSRSGSAGYSEEAYGTEEGDQLPPAEKSDKGDDGGGDGEKTKTPAAAAA